MVGRRASTWVAAAVLVLAASATVRVGSVAAIAATGATADPLLVADVGALTQDERLLFTALEGIVNRDQPRIYLEGMDSTAPTWLTLAVPLTMRVVAPYDLLTAFGARVQGMVVWDPALAVDTQNVATTMAGVDDVVPVSPALAQRLSAPPYSLRTVADLRDEHFGNGPQAYDWALRHLGPASRFSHVAWLGGLRRDRHGLRDYIVARRGFAFEAQPQQDHDFIMRLLANWPDNTPVLGYPFYDDQAYEASCTVQCVPLDEPIGVGEISQSGKFLIPTDLASNLSVHSWFPPIRESPPWDDHARAPVLPGDAQKTYVAFVITDGDNVGYNEQEVMWAHFRDPARGSIPMGISFSTWLPVLAPRIYDYYVHQLAPSEVLVAGPSGGGYVYPGVDPALDPYLAQTARLLDVSGLKSVWVLDNGYAYSPTPATLDRYVSAVHPSALITDYFGWVVPNPPSVSFASGVPVVHAIWGDSVASAVARIRLSSASSVGRPAFVLVALNTWGMGPTQARQVMDQLRSDPASDYEVVRPDEFFGLVRGVYGPLASVPTASGRRRAAAPGQQWRGRVRQQGFGAAPAG